MKYPGITLCNVYPGPVQSDIVKNALTEELSKVKILEGEKLNPLLATFALLWKSGAYSELLMNCLRKAAALRKVFKLLDRLQCLALTMVSDLARRLLINRSPLWIHHSY